jgi:RHS repeat-associated protein
MLKAIIIILLVVCGAVNLSAKVEPRIDFPMQGNAFVILNNTGTVIHSAQIGTSTNWSNWTNGSQEFRSYINTLELRQLENVALPVDYDYNLKITGKLEIWTIGSSTPVPHQITLEINHDPAPQAKSRRLDFYTYSNAYDSKFTLQTLTLTTQGTMPPAALYAAVSKVVELNFGIQGTRFTAPVYNTAPILHTPCLDNVTNELVVSWAPVDFAEEYELEITFRDNYTRDIAVARPASTIPYDFRENATRIVTKATHYRIPLVYEKGYLLYRVRAVGMGGAEWDRRIPCIWSSGPASSGMVGSFPDRYGPIVPHMQEKMNWQLSTTYSDEGKRKDVAQYYDGLYMSRQTVTGVNQYRNAFTSNVQDWTPRPASESDMLQVLHTPEGLQGGPEIVEDVPAARERGGGSPPPGGGGMIPLPLPNLPCSFYGSDKVKEIIAQEVIYDFNGRPAVQILPVPTGIHRITYIRKLNRNAVGQSYSWQDFDRIEDCLLPADPQQNNASAALSAAAYYSPNNPNRIGYNAFIPDAKQYPFSRVQFTGDNTGRTFRQGGAGVTHQLESGHETKFFYGKPNQAELDRMFGTEVGYDERYQKNTVVDPNGQASVSYINPEGKTIATALSGIKPDNLMPLDNESYPEKMIAVDLIGNNTPDPLEHSLTVTETFTVAQPTQYTFTYNVRGETLSYSSCVNNQICLDCIYDLEITLIANEGCVSPLFSYTGTFGDMIKQSQAVHTDLECYDAPLGSAEQNDAVPYIDRLDGFPAAAPASFMTPAQSLLPAGSYTLVKKLTVNRAAAEAYVNLVFKDTCQEVLDKFIEEEWDRIDSSDCFQSCTNCQAKVPAQNCDALCPVPMDECQQARAMMLKDFELHGQYADFDVVTTGTGFTAVTAYNASSYPLSIFNPNNVLGKPAIGNGVPAVWQTAGLTLPDGTAITDLQTLIENWDPVAFPPKLLQFHPEYCMLQWCDTENKSAADDLAMKLMTKYTDATAAGTGVLTFPSTIPAHEQLFNADKFFTTAPTGMFFAAEFLEVLRHPCPGSASILDLAMEAAFCQAMFSQSPNGVNSQAVTQPNDPAIYPPMPTCVIPPTFHIDFPFGSVPTTAYPISQDLQWQMLRDLYLTYKERYLYLSRRFHAQTNGCFNACIGTDQYALWHNPSSGGMDFSGSIEGIWPTDQSHVCGDLYPLYANKVKRFVSRYDAFPTSGNPIDLAGFDPYSPCPSPTGIASIQSQTAAIVGEHICDTTLLGEPFNIDCWNGEFAGMLNQYLPLVTPVSPVNLSGSTITTALGTALNTITGLNVSQIMMEFVAATGKYHIRLMASNGKACDFWFPAVLVNNTLKPVSGVCCLHMLSPTTVRISLLYADGTNAYMALTSECRLPTCPTPGAPAPFDTCATLSPQADELFAFLATLDESTAPVSGPYQGVDNTHTIEQVLDPTRPMQYEMDPATCTLTFSTVYPQTSGGRGEQPTLDPDPNHPVAERRRAPCTITFANCNWLGDDTELLSIEPFYPAGGGNTLTNEFVLTWRVVLSPTSSEIFTVRGTSNCFPINDCSEPFLCSSDTIPNLVQRPYNACVANKLLTAGYLAYDRYGKWVDSMKNDLREKYYAQCLKAKESINYTYPDRQFHYTLYYYDQAGNLVRTVPPSGVSLLDPSDVASVQASRDSRDVNGMPNGTPILPTHAFITNYAYNSLNQNRWQITPDAGRSDFWYDRLGRIVASQNAVQKQSNSYSYSWYDKLGRIVEGGKITLPASATLSTTAVANYPSWKLYLYNGAFTRTEITYTQYDEPFSTGVSGQFGVATGQQNLRGRVASVLSFEDKGKQLSGTYRHATHYTYDATGNVPILIQDYPGTPLGSKVIAYNFDLLTGKVNEVRYQPGEVDEFRHKYRYDDELRLMQVVTSRKGIVWENDATYFYYKHGPLARTELGDLKVQGLDYIYTLQGWIKGVNGTTQTRGDDAGRDGIALEQPGPAQIVVINGQPATVYSETSSSLNISGPGYHSLHSSVGADAYGYVLNYYGGDYTPIVPALNPVTGMNSTTGDVQPLYNGNISAMYTWLHSLGGLGMNYRYDQLNRLKKQEAFTIDASGTPSLVPHDSYGMALTYDGNGNIISLRRRGRGGVNNIPMDDLTYHYLDANNNVIPSMANPPANATNRLGYVEDQVADGNYPESSPMNGTVTDIDNQSSGNYAYDAIGNLIKDDMEGISDIRWNLQNKIAAIDKIDPSELRFAYDALGNRVYKKFQSPVPSPYPAETYYVRDGQGNIIAMYEVKVNGFYLQEQNLHAGGRLGLWYPEMLMAMPSQGLAGTIDWQSVRPVTLVEDNSVRGSRKYQLSNHLGNVLVTVSDQRAQTFPVTGASGITADVMSITDYFAFGMPVPGRNINTGWYRFGFNGKENDNEIGGEGSLQDYGMRVYDSRVGKFLSSDPLFEDYPWYSPYSFAGNNPIWAIDLDGLEEFIVVDKVNGAGEIERHYERTGTDKGKGTYEYRGVERPVSSATGMDKQMFKAFYRPDGKASIVRENYYVMTPKKKTEDEVKVDVEEKIKTVVRKKVKLPVGSKSTPPPAVVKPIRTVKVNTPLDLDVTFNGDKNTFETSKSTKAQSEIISVITSLIKNPGLTAVIHIGTMYREDQDTRPYVSSPQALVGSRLTAVQDVIDKYAPAGFDKSRIQMSPNYGTNLKATVTYKEP